MGRLDQVFMNRSNNYALFVLFQLIQTNLYMYVLIVYNLVYYSMHVCACVF